MTFVQALYTIIAVLGLSGVVFMVRLIIVQRRAEAKLIGHLAESPEVKAFLDRAEANGWPRRPLPARAADRIRALVDREAERLSEDERRTILEAVYQPTVHGRENYLDKLLEGSARELQHAH